MNTQKLLELSKERSHWEGYAEFARWETAAGGVDPHMRLAGYLSKGEPVSERIWRAGVYMGVYNVPTAMVIWREWNAKRVLKEDMLPWITEHWGGIATRRERRSVRVKTQMQNYFTDFANWATQIQSSPALTKAGLHPKERYELLWGNLSNSVRYAGRYAVFKILEFCRRFCEFDIEMPDIRPEGGWSPREALVLLFPEYSEALTGKDTAQNIAVINRCAEKLQTVMREKFGLNLDLYTLEVCLCDYKQSYVGRRQFPGRSQDSEIMYYNKIAGHWGESAPKEMFAARRKIFPHEALGELNGWNDVRKELGDTLRVYGYTWSDLI